MALPIVPLPRVIGLKTAGFVAPQATVSVRQMYDGPFGAASGVRLEITNWNEVMKYLVSLDKKYVSELRKEFKKIARPVQLEVKKAIPNKGKPPLSGMKQVHFGRLAWGSSYGKGAKPSKSVLVQVPNTRKRKYRGKDIAIARIQVQSPATVLADMAGRKSNTKARKGLTPKYDYMYTINGQKVPGKRQHRVSPWNFVTNISGGKYIKQSYASRFVWPAALKALPQARREMEEVITATNLRINQILRNV